MREPPYAGLLTLIVRLIAGKIAQPTMSRLDAVLGGLQNAEVRQHLEHNKANATKKRDGEQGDKDKPAISELLHTVELFVKVVKAFHLRFLSVEQEPPNHGRAIFIGEFYHYGRLSAA